jgi:ribonuclease Z
MFELAFLGTSASAPSVQRGLSANVVMHKEYRFLIDCGEGTQRQLLQSGLGFRRLDKILLTHGHLDHILGLGGLVSTLSRWETMDRIEIFGGRWTLARVRDLINRVVLRGASPPLKIEYVLLQPGLIFRDNSFSLSAFPVIHRDSDCFGFSFVEHPKRPFLVEPAEILGVPAGPERKRLVAGETVTLADGRVVHPDQVLGPPQPGAKLVFISDAGKVDTLLEPALNADVLVIEATYLSREEDMARRFGHLTAAQAAKLAHEAGVKELYLTHLSRRYRDRDVLAEAQTIFPNTTIARDFDQVKVVKQK